MTVTWTLLMTIAFGYESNELLRIFDGFRILRYAERLGIPDFPVDGNKRERLVRRQSDAERQRSGVYCEDGDIAGGRIGRRPAGNVESVRGPSFVRLRSASADFGGLVEVAIN